MTIMQSSSVCNNLNNNNLFLSTNQQLSISLHSLVAFVALFGKLSFSTSFMCETSCAMFGQFRKYANRFTRKHNSKAISGILWSFEPNIVLLFPQHKARYIVLVPFLISSIQNMLCNVYFKEKGIQWKISWLWQITVWG